MNDLCKRYPILYILIAIFLVGYEILSPEPYRKLGFPMAIFVPLLFLAFGLFGISSNRKLRRAQRQGIYEAHEANVDQWQYDSRRWQ